VILRVRGISRTIGRLNEPTRADLKDFMISRLNIDEIEFNLYPTDVEWQDEENERLSRGEPPQYCAGWLGDVLSIYLVVKGSQITEAALKKIAEQVATGLAQWIKRKLAPERDATVIILFDAYGREIHRTLVGDRRGASQAISRASAGWAGRFNAFLKRRFDIHK